MPETVIIFAPRFDQATEYSYAWALDVKAHSEQKGNNNINLLIIDAVKQKLEDELRNHPFALFIFYDHGNEDCLWGNDSRHAVDLTNNVLLRNRECYTMACLSAKELGADSYRRYGTIFWGSWENISFTTDALPLFEEALNFGIKLRLDGTNDWNLIMDKTIENDNKVIDEMISEGKIFAAALMRENRDARRVWTSKTPPPDKPDTTCPLRKASLFLLGQQGWGIPNPLG